MLRQYIKEYFDYKLFLSVLLLFGIGLVSIYSATYTVGLSEIFEKQIFWIVIGFLLMFLMFLLPSKFIEFISLPFYIFMMVILLSVPFLGQTVSGSTSWFNFGSFKIQPSEIGKAAMILCLAAFLSKSSSKINELKTLSLAALIPIIPFGLIMLQPDFGTATVYLFIFILMMYWAGTKAFYIYGIVATGIAMLSAILNIYFLIAIIAISILVLFLLKENWTIILAFTAYVLAVGLSFDYIYDRLALYQQKRINTFLNPALDPLGAGYNSIQAKVAIGSGGVLGKGFLQGTQTQLKFIPKQWTDFIFCVPGEEFGLVGSLIVVLLLFLVFFRILKIATLVKSKFSSLVAIGSLSLFLCHTIINIGMTTGLLPVMGIPLPFLSYGGSLVLTTSFLIGILMNFYSHRKNY